MIKATAGYKNFLEMHDISSLPNPVQLRQWVRLNAITDALKPCHSPYCECAEGKCTHPGFYDARHLPVTQAVPLAETKGI